MGWDYFRRDMASIVVAQPAFQFNEGLNKQLRPELAKTYAAFHSWESRLRYIVSLSGNSKALLLLMSNAHPGFFVKPGLVYLGCFC
jgi:hypothetical protein